MTKVIVFCLIFLSFIGSVSTSFDCKSNKNCGNGYCKDGKCVCNPGWWGDICEFCRVSLTNTKGMISDGEGPHKVDSKLMWLVKSGGSGKVVNLAVEQFASECSWDHLYIYDGDSIDAPLLATLSGLIKDYSVKETANEPILQVVATSGKAYLYFYSDANYYMSGFNISYSVVSGCPNDCSSHGLCNSSGHCVCKNGWTGSDCSVETFLKPCVNGTYDSNTRMCVCTSGATGTDCSLKAGIAHWERRLALNQDIKEGRAKHASSILGDWMWIFGGYSLNSSQLSLLTRYNIITNKWEIVTPVSGPAPSLRYGHTMVAYKDCLYVFGGEVDNKSVNELWVFNTSSLTWLQLHPSGSKLAHASLHSANVVDDKMIVLLGRSSVYKYIEWVQEYDFENNIWDLIEATGSDKIAGSGHTSVYDPHNKLIYVHGGYIPKLTSHSSHEMLSSQLHAYSPNSKIWLTLKESGYPVYLHSAVFYGRLMYVFGGNRHNDTNENKKNSKCYSDVLNMYDTVCDKWYALDRYPGLSYGLSRYGHTAHMIDRIMYVFGGFNGRLFGDILTLSLGDCDQYKTSSTCTSHFKDSGCAWKNSANKCLSPDLAALNSLSDLTWPTCPECETKTSCSSCVQIGCEWCESRCMKTCNKMPSFKTVDQCPRDNFCSNVVSCQICEASSDCAFYPASKTCVNVTNKDPIPSPSTSQCTNCNDLTSCSDCVSKACMWCESARRCVEFSSYVVSFPFGQCRQWTSSSPTKCSDAICSERKTCNDCHSLPGCGWCDDGSKSGLGHCMEGGNSGPVTRYPTQNTTNQCPKASWFFMDCPKCQCNGHSTCYNEFNCNPCQHDTTGPNCQRCRDGMYGDARNGGTCKPCQCNKQAKICSTTGTCTCLARGVIGEHCERCGTGYRGNSTNGGFCYHDLSSDYEYKFNISVETSINFFYMPLKPDQSVEFKIKIKSGGPVNVNITTQTESMNHENTVINKVDTFEMRELFVFEEYSFGGRDKRRFLVYVYNFKGLIFEISFVQQPVPINLLHFFITFFGGFFSLLFVATVFWKVKRRYDAYMHYRRRNVEMAQMASRPFAQSIALIEDVHQVSVKHPVTVIATEPCYGNQAAVQTIIMKLPNTSQGVTPIGQSGICFASALVTYGNSHSNRDDVTHNSKRGVSRQQTSRITGCL